jgi:tetratricopeptide (TPR) repeat protein
MARVEKTVFISYRRTNAPWALAIVQNLTHHGYDVFFDFNGIASGDFESVILENIRSRAHFVILLTPSALERCGDPGDWLRREIEEALAIKRNIVPLMLEGFDFGTPSIANQLTGKLEALKSYNALNVPADYFTEAMGRLRQHYLNVPLKAVLHPASLPAQRATKRQQVAADTAPKVLEKELTAQQWFERGFDTKDLDEKVRFYSQAIRLKPDFAVAFVNRGNARKAKGDLEGALQDYNEAIRFKPDYALALNNRGATRKEKGDLDGALQDYDQAIRLKPDYFDAFYNRGNARKAKGDLEGALQDYNEAIRLKPDHASAFYNRGIVHKTKGDLGSALQDYTEAIRLKPDHAEAFYNRALIFQDQASYEAAIADLQKYLDHGGGVREGDQQQVEQMIRGLRSKLDVTREKWAGAKAQGQKKKKTRTK